MTAKKKKDARESWKSVIHKALKQATWGDILQAAAEAASVDTKKLTPEQRLEADWHLRRAADVFSVSFPCPREGEDEPRMRWSQLTPKQAAQLIEDLADLLFRQARSWRRWVADTWPMADTPVAVFWAEGMGLMGLSNAVAEYTDEDGLPNEGKDA